MAARMFQTGPTFPTDQQGEGRDWVVLDPARNRRDLTSGTSQTKLLFNEAIPASAGNRATRVYLPVPIVIERLLPLSERRENVDSTGSSFSFTALSEERLQAAVKLAKRDLRRRRRESLIKSPVKPSQEASLLETSDAELLQELEATPNRMKLKTSSPKDKTARPAKQTSWKPPVSKKPWFGRSPLTRDPRSRQPEGGKPTPLSQEIFKLQNELDVYIQKVEELANRGEEMEEPLEPEEKNKLEVRRQKQAARSSQIIYVLQQQVKEVKEDIEKLRTQQMTDTKKSSAVNRLAAAHRGALRALKDVIHQLSDLSLSKMPPHYKELGQLIRQLSLCSAKVEVDQGSAVPETALNILQKLETLDSALRKQEMIDKVQAQTCPPHRKSPHRSMSPTRVLKGPSSSNVQGPCKPRNPKRGVHAGRRMASQKPKTTFHRPPMNRAEVLRAGLESLAQQSGLRDLQGRPQTNATCRKGLHPERRKADVILKRNQGGGAGFQQPTVSSRLRVNEVPERDPSVPWIPTSPHSPPPQRRSPQRGRPEPRCLFSPAKPAVSPPKPNAAAGYRAEPDLSSVQKKQAQNEALRNAWLDKMTTQRLKELNQLSKEEAERIQRFRSEVVSPTQWAERAEQKARERIQPLLDEAQIGESRSRISYSMRNRLSEQAAERAAETAEQLSEDLLEDLVEDTARAAWAAETDRQLEGLAQCRLQAPTLESMLLRMEEIQKDQDEVRRRFTSITYSDPLYWDRPGAAGPQCHAPGSIPAPPQPIRLTRPVLKQTTAADIVLQRPVDTGFLSEDSRTEEASEEEQQARNTTVFPGPVERSTGTIMSVPASTLRNIRRYREDYDAYLRVVAHENVGSFNPWATANSLADELLSEAVADVAAEFQDVVEEYAEAVFTSEFLQPVQSPPAPAAALVSQ
ncbi:protein moonraker isoform X4 [Hippoglossus stenolepis]|uniref:protein moonraker isoform X4 n=1 Tax=Hippoglossus stenolepis TaxID=195615 RepID=UPI001FB027CF|nr:protein moonraker isoform X4 [Hippoglossus stenolepis]